MHIPGESIKWCPGGVHAWEAEEPSSSLDASTSLGVRILMVGGNGWCFIPVPFTPLVCVWDSCPGLSGMAEHTPLTLDAGDQKQVVSHWYTQTRGQGPSHHAEPVGRRHAASRSGAPGSG